jgi:hypothetical protein
MAKTRACAEESVKRAAKHFARGLCTGSDGGRSFAANKDEALGLVKWCANAMRRHDNR